jgi:hypothetical protein
MRIAARPASVVCLCVCLLVPFTTFPEGLKHSTTLSVEGAYYIDDNKGFSVDDGGLAPVSYTPVENTGS